MRSSQRIGRAWGAILLIVLSCGPVAAQSPRPPAREGPGAPEPEVRPEAPPTPEEIREAMEALLIARLKRVLSLSTGQEERVVPRVRELLETRREHAARRRAAARRLRALAGDETSDDAEIERRLRDFRVLEREDRERDERLRAAIGAELTPRQHARWLFFEERFRRLMQRRLRDAMAGSRPPGPPGEVRPPGGRRGAQAPGRPGSPGERFRSEPSEWDGEDDLDPLPEDE
ncbi:MAG: hypothetical protein ACRD5D_08410 [Candidatus Polarisedimenticolia bacterium]